MKWKENLKKAALEMVSSASVGMFGSIVSWNNSQARILCCLLREEVVSREEIATVLHRRIRRSGMASFEEHVRSRFVPISDTPPDHTHSPEAFAYALSKGEFTLEEERSIRFDHGEDKEAFIRLYCKDADAFLARAVEWVLTEQPPAPPATEGEGSRADWCSDGPCCCDSH